MLGNHEKCVLQVVNSFAAHSAVYVQDVIETTVAAMSIPGAGLRDNRRVCCVKALRSLVERDMVAINADFVSAVARRTISRPASPGQRHSELAA